MSNRDTTHDRIGMVRWRRGRLDAVRARWPGVIEYDAHMFDPHGEAHDDGHPCRAIAYTDTVGHPEPGDVVLLSTAALDRGLGTGGVALVVAVPDRLPPDTHGPGHLVKARYTPLQAMVLGVDEQDSPAHHVLADADDLHAMPVVTADLHSALPAVVTGIRHVDPTLRVAYVMTDGGALPAAFSRTVAQLRAEDHLTACITVGQAYGGDLDAVTLHTGLLASRHVVEADIAVVAQGPGNLGTGTRWGFSGIAAGEAVNAVNTLHGRAVASLRVSQADPRERHRGLSHHSITAYGRVALTPADVPVPTPTSAFDVEVLDAARALCTTARLHLVEIDVDPGLEEALATGPVRLSTMGRGLAEDRASFVAAAVAGVHAAHLARTPRRDRGR